MTRIRERLENWGRYWRDTDGFAPARCRSIEGRYLRELDSRIAAEEVQEQIATRAPAPDMHDAVRVNEAWKVCRQETKRLLRVAHCMGRVEDATIARMSEIRIEALPLRYAKAVREIENVLASRETGARIRANNLHDSSTSQSHPASSRDPSA